MSEFNRVQLTTDSEPVEGQYYGEAADGSREGGFRDQAALVRAVNDPRYRTDQAYHAEVARLVAKTSEGILTGNKPEAASFGSGDVIHAQVESVEALFGNPLYAKSAAYRAEVARIIAAQGKNDGVSRLQAMGDPSGAYRVNMSPDSTVAPMMPGGAQKVSVQDRIESYEDGGNE